VGTVDESLSDGKTGEALGEIVEEASGLVTGLAFVIEKSFMKRRTRLEAHEWPVFAGAVVTSLDGGEIPLA